VISDSFSQSRNLFTTDCGLSEKRFGKGGIVAEDGRQMTDDKGYCIVLPEAAAAKIFTYLQNINFFPLLKNPR
jgi:hypothetical protein